MRSMSRVTKLLQTRKRYEGLKNADDHGSKYLFDPATAMNDIFCLLKEMVRRIVDEKSWFQVEACWVDV